MIAASIMQNKIANTEAPIYSIMVIEGMRGYIILEAEDEVACRQFITKGKNIRGVLPKPLGEEDVKKLIESKSQPVKIERGDFVELTSGPLKGYEAKVMKVDEAKGTMVVERLDVVVPIALTVKISTAKLVRKVKTEGAEKPSGL